jgi:hypothetical protein
VAAILGGQKVLLKSVEDGLGFFSFLRKLKKDPDGPVNPV